MKGVRFLNEAERAPLLTNDGRKLLKWMQEHPHAPKYNYQCGDQLTAAMLERVRAYAQELAEAKPQGAMNETPDWVLHFAERCLIEVPFYRRRGGRADDFFALPTCSRKDLENEQWAFVPDSQALDDLIMYYTSGTTGKPFYILSHPEVSSKYLVKLRAALAHLGIRLEGGQGRVSILTPCAQKTSLTYATVSAYLDGAGYVKVNLNPADWRKQNDAAQFIDDCQPEIYTGDPISFLALAQLPLHTRPKALVSSAMTLLPALRSDLEKHFECPVLDVYSLNESRFVAASFGVESRIIPHDVFVEILDPEGRNCPTGERGEIALTCNRNPFLPLLRYRTGDYAALKVAAGSPVLSAFEGRQPVMFRNTEGKIINNIEVTQALENFPLTQFSLHQNADHSLLFCRRGNRVEARFIEAALQHLFGATQRLTIAELHEDDTRNGKLLSYTSDLPELPFAEVEMAFP
ncbi:MAG: AMP-binding protein [Acidobacteria bacterium]|nr:AMP-binding protein [Acidobacteriota bacterium]